MYLRDDPHIWCKMQYVAKDDIELLILLNVQSAGIIDMSHLPVYAELWVQGFDMEVSMSWVT